MATSSDDRDEVLVFTRGDPARASLLRTQLRRIEASSVDPEVRRLVAEVLDGRRSVRELVLAPAMERALDRGMVSFADHWGRMSPSERLLSVQQGAAEETVRRQLYGLPPRDEPPPRLENIPLLRRD